MQRDRKFPSEHFFKKHASARQVLLWIAQNYFEVEVRLYRNYYKKGGLDFTEVLFESRKKLIEYINKNQYNEEEIANLAIK